MRILIVTHHYLGGYGGGVFGSRGFINALAELGDAVTLLCPVREDNQPEEIDARVRIVPVWDRRSEIRKMLDLIRGRIHRFGQAFPAELAAHPYDLVVFDTCYPSFRQIDRAHAAGCKVMTIHHNFQWEYVRDNARGMTRPFELFWTRRCEQEALLKSDLNLVVTDCDRELLYDHYDSGRRSRIAVIGDFESAPRKLERPEPHPDEPVFVITGDLGAVQTEESLLPWIEQYYPLLLQRVPDARVLVAGKNPSGNVRAACRKAGFELIDTPPDMGAVLARGRYYVCPTALGGGLKLRIMDGLKSGMPVLTHAVSARGYESFEGFCLYSYHDRDSFVTALDALLGSKAAPEAIVAAYTAVFSFESGLERMRSCLSQL